MSEKKKIESATDEQIAEFRDSGDDRALTHEMLIARVEEERERKRELAFTLLTHEGTIEDVYELAEDEDDRHVLRLFDDVGGYAEAERREEGLWRPR